MKKAISVLSSTAALCLAIGSGCGQKEAESPAASSPAPAGGANPASNLVTRTKEAVGTAAAEVKEGAQKVAAETKQAAQNAVTTAKEQVSSAVSNAKDESQGLIEKVKTYIAEKKYEDAVTSLKQLSSVKLTPEQQKVVDDLKAQLQKMMANQAASDATKAAGDLFKK